MTKGKSVFNRYYRTRLKAFVVIPRILVREYSLLVTTIIVRTTKLYVLFRKFFGRIRVCYMLQFGG